MLPYSYPCRLCPMWWHYGAHQGYIPSMKLETIRCTEIGIICAETASYVQLNSIFHSCQLNQHMYM